MAKCPICGCVEVRDWVAGLKHNYISKETEQVWDFKYLECAVCKLGFIDPFPDESLIKTFYPPDYIMYRPRNKRAIEYKSLKYQMAQNRYVHLVGENVSFAKQFEMIVAIASEVFSGKTISHTLGLPMQLHKEAEILDVGYGNGDWLMNMSHLGYVRLNGYDISANQNDVDKLKTRGIKITSGNFLENDYKESAFDLIRMEHVFEHLIDPVGVLRKCRTMLKPGGLLVMNFPSKEAWSSTFSPRHYCYLQPPIHLFHHTMKSCKLILSQTGFTTLDVKYIPVFAGLTETFSKLLEEHGLKVWIPRIATLLLSPVYKCFSNLTARGELITVAAMKERE